MSPEDPREALELCLAQRPAARWQHSCLTTIQQWVSLSGTGVKSGVQGQFTEFDYLGTWWTQVMHQVLGLLSGQEPVACLMEVLSIT